jgi:hypothetical protein
MKIRFKTAAARILSTQTAEKLVSSCVTFNREEPGPNIDKLIILNRLRGFPQYLKEDSRNRQNY